MVPQGRHERVDRHPGELEADEQRRQHGGDPERVSGVGEETAPVGQLL